MDSEGDRPRQLQHARVYRFSDYQEDSYVWCITWVVFFVVLLFLVLSSVAWRWAAADGAPHHAHAHSLWHAK